MRAQRERTIQRAPAVVEFLRGAFFADGAEGESVHLACDIIEALGAELALAAGAEAATPSERCAAARRAFQSTADPAKGWRRVVRAVDASRPKEP
jgi:hypothetical protein